MSAPPAFAPAGMLLLRDEKQSIEPEAKLLNAQRDQLSSKARFEDLQEQLAINRRGLNTNYQLLKESRKRLDIVAPVDGWFVSSIAEGGFVLAGDPVGIIHLGVTTAQKQQLTCAAPDDSIVELLRTTNGEVLSDGEPVVSLKSNRIEKYKVRLQAAKDDLAVQQRFFTRGRKEKWETRLREAAESGERRVKNAELIEAQSKIYLQTGGQYTDYVAAICDRLDAQRQLVSAKLDLEQFPKKVKDLEDRAKSTEKQISTEDTLYNDLVARMKVFPPRGVKVRFVASVGEGSFVQCGDPIGVFEL